MLRWRILSCKKRQYVFFGEDADGRFVILVKKESSTVFEGTRDYIDGICFGLEHCIDDFFEAEPIIHVQKPAHHEKMDDTNEGE